MKKYEGRADERDMMFRRYTYKEGTPEHEDYYSRRPEKLEMDNKLRSRPFMGDENSVHYNSIINNLYQANFDFTAILSKHSPGEPIGEPVEGTAEQFSEILLGLAKNYGAKDVRIIELEERHHFSHRGGAGRYGEEIHQKYKYAFVISVEMEKELIDTAPRAPMTLSVTKGYVDVFSLGLLMALAIRRLGYEATHNMGAEYVFPFPSLAEEAGIGEVGKHGMLITKEFGPRVRLGVVSTNIPLVPTKVEDLHIREYCELCDRCIKRCPSKAIGHTLEEYKEQQCFNMWQKFGTDCGMCLSTCPFSHNLPQELIADLSTTKARQKLYEYVEENVPFSVDSKNMPDFIKPAYK